MTGLKDRVIEYAESHPGCTPKDIAVALEIGPDLQRGQAYVRKTAARNGIRLNPSGGITHSHLNEKGQFQSDKHPHIGPDKILLSFKDPRARKALAVLADSYDLPDPVLARDIRERLRTVRYGTRGRK